MIFDEEARALIDACHRDPFAVLGMHADTHGRLWVRVLLPGATSCPATQSEKRKQGSNIPS